MHCCSRVRATSSRERIGERFGDRARWNVVALVHDECWDELFYVCRLKESYGTFFFIRPVCLLGFK